MRKQAIWLTALLLSAMPGIRLPAADVIPHAQDKPPGPPLSPQEAIGKMTVPEGFRVELVASEPDIVNPVAMTFDERGRIWITESLEYPRHEVGPGRDRIKVLEDTDGDGRADKFTVFGDGFNIPSGIAVGYGGVWVANAPDILFLQDTDGDGRADQREVVVTGFGRDDTHELPNSLTWGPDGWLYGLNGVFNASQITQNARQFNFTCALFRIHPRTHEFQLFAQGTSNPWGIAWDGEGSAFVSACVIDHLWHLAEGAYYIRQGGPYPPFTSPMGSIVNHKHQKAAYCGIHFFDSDAYPEEYRERLYMGNIHGSAVNVDSLARDGSTYVGNAEPDFLAANDAWFMPVVQKTGPDGCLYILDWYDRYHCYQDARRDPEGIDRLKGRLYRVRYGDTPRAARFDMGSESDEKLIERLRSANVFFRDIAQRLLAERHDNQTRGKLEELVMNESEPRKARMHALWALVGGGPLRTDFHERLLNNVDAGFRAWAVRAAGNSGDVAPGVRDKVVALASDRAPEVRLQVAIAARKLAGVHPGRVLLDVLSESADDKLIPHVVWQNLYPLLEDHGSEILSLLVSGQRRSRPGVAAIMPKVIDRILAGHQSGAALELVRVMFTDFATDNKLLARCLAALTAKLEAHEITAEQLDEIRPQVEPVVRRTLAGDSGDSLYVDAALLGAIWKDGQALEVARRLFMDGSLPASRRAQALDALVAARDQALEVSVAALFQGQQTNSVELRAAALSSLARLQERWVANVVLANYEQLEAELRPRAIGLLTQRRVWAESLLDAIAAGRIPAAALNANQVRQLLIEADEELAARIARQWGSIRSERDPKRDEVIAQMRTFLRTTPGDPTAGQQVYKRVCGQCHKLYGQGEDVGPDISSNGRNSFEQLLSNVFDPSLVIGASYQARTVVTTDGRVLTGLVAEDNDQRVVLKTQGGKLETIARADLETMSTSKLSLMPEDLEKQLQPQELADLFALLTLDKPPGDPTARRLPGSQAIVPRETSNPAEFRTLVDQVAPGFTASKVGKLGLAIVAEHAGWPGVLKTQSVNVNEPCVLRGAFDIPKDKRSRLVLKISHDPQATWTLKVNADGHALYQSAIGLESKDAAWQTVSVDLTSHAGKKVTLNILHGAHGGKTSPAYWGQVEIISE